MVANDDISLGDYIRLLARRVKDPPCIDRYDEFLIKVWDFFSLRVAAEKYFDNHKHVAYSRHGALPVTWELLRDTWRTVGPPEQTITLIAKRNYNDVNALIGNLRKILNRIRQKVAIARVQQVDAHCLRWLIRQPGKTPAEKGGSRQEILGVVRVENYNTLENRVLKDFMRRCIGLSTMYLRHYDKPAYRDHVNVRAVARFKNLCIGGLSTQEFESVQEISDLQQPNYVLQQDRLYSKIWTSYCDILRQEDIAEKLWSRRAEIDDLYSRCNAGIALHCDNAARYNTPLWVNVIDGKKDILECPIWHNETDDSPVTEPSPPESDVQAIDFTFPWDGRDELVVASNHRNARPFIQNPHRPSLEPGEVISLQEILRQRNESKLREYFRQLYALIGGSRWIILVPDDWDSRWLESVIRSHPFLTRDKVFLLWRSIAAALGFMERRKFNHKDSIVVVDGYAVPFYNAVELRFMNEPNTGRVLPQRSSVRLHGSGTPNCQDVRFICGCSFSDQSSVFKIGGLSALRIGIGLLSEKNFVQQDNSFVYARKDNLLVDGVGRYLADEALGLVSYFDERDALSLVVQNRAEEVEFKILVEHDECSPGGRPYRGALMRGGALQAGASRLALNLLEGEHRDDEPLKEMKVVLEQKTPETTDIFFEAMLTPGQGLASILFKADFLEKPLPLDLTELKTSDNTKSRIEREMKRHFPPVMPYVEASEDIWKSVKFSTLHYLQSGIPPNETGLFYHPQPYWGSVDPNGQTSFRLFGYDRFFDDTKMSPVDLLKRENVFGNAPGHEYPTSDFDWSSLFRRLAYDYRRGKDVLRMIAWTYQYKNTEFEFIRKELHSRYVQKLQALSIVEYTFCSNCFGKGDKRITDILRHVLERIAGNVATENELRLTYNLLQFHPEAVEPISSELCEKAFMRLYRSYNTYQFLGRDGYLQRGGQATKMIGYFLKCMLFLLHRRRFDSGFLYRSEDWQPSGFLSEPIPVRRYASGKEYPTQRAHERLRVSFLNYVRGHGTIDGIPIGD